jgi:Cu(I)/Ag(I) efflux system membrane fusion protein
MMANIFENQTNQVKTGMSVKVTMNGVLGRSWSGKVEYIYPQLDDATRTARVRIVLNNPDLTLKPGMYGNVMFNNENKAASLLIPTQAIIMSPTENRVIVALGNGVFQVRKVTLGNEVGDMTQVISGLSSGEQIVSNGEFMLDSEASLSAGVSRVDSSESQAISTQQKPDSQMDGMDMSSTTHEHTH